MKIAVAQLNGIPGDVEGNCQEVLKAFRSFEEQGADLLVLPAFALEGHPAFDLYFDVDFRKQVAQAFEKVKKASFKIPCVMGGVLEENGHLYNALYFLYQGEIAGVATKKNLSRWDWLDENRYFKAGAGAEVFKFGRQQLAVTFQEDAAELVEKNQGIDLSVFYTTRAFSLEEYSMETPVTQALAHQLKSPVLESKAVGGQGDVLFEGGSKLFSSQGEVLAECESFKQDLTLFDVGDPAGTRQPVTATQKEDLELLHMALVMGLRDFFKKQGFEKAILGLSGGLDSALVAALACEALGSENVLSVLMPSVYSTEHSLKDALDLVKNTGCKHLIMPIKEVVSSTEALFVKELGDPLRGLASENIQARARGLVLMGLSNKYGHVVLNTSNKSESAVGYGTLYGDMVGGLSVIGDVFKTQAFALARYMNKEREIIPLNTLVKPPSAELRPDQKDSDSLPDYTLLDGVLSLYIEKGFPASRIKEEGFDPQLVERTLSMVKKAEYKRFQSAPVLRVSKNISVGEDNTP